MVNRNISLRDRGLELKGNLRKTLKKKQDDVAVVRSRDFTNVDIMKN